jgi:hypothetical protein
MVFKAIRLSWRILDAFINEPDEDLLVPMVVSQIYNDRHQHGEGLVLVGLQDVEEVVVLKEAHGSVSYLQVDSANASHNSLEESGNQVFNLIHLTNLQHFLQFCQEQCFLDAVSEGPIFEQSFQESDGKSSVLGEEEHGASEELFIELGTCLHLMKRDDNVLEEDHVLISQGHCKATDDAGQDVEEFSSSVELVGFMDE